MNVTITINGKRVQVGVPTGQMLLRFLRGQGHRSMKYGYETTNCSLRSAWMSEKVVLSCSVPMGRAGGHHITTLEGVEKEAKELADLMAEEGAEQCGFCSLGMMMQVLAMKEENRTWTDEEIKHWLVGNLCHYTGYMGQLRAIRAWLLRGGEAA